MESKRNDKVSAPSGADREATENIATPKVRDCLTSFETQIKTLENWVSQREINEMTEFIYDALDETWASRKQEFASISEWLHAKNTEKRKVEQAISGIVSKECDRRNEEDAARRKMGGT